MTLRMVAPAAFFVLSLCGAAWGGNQLPLSRIPVPEPPNLSQFVKDRSAAIRLGKALFWDMQAGSDGTTACASCHYRAGADPLTVRPTNQLHPGPDGAFQVKVPGPGSTLTSVDYPFFQVLPVTSRIGIDTGTVVRNFNDVTGSQGMFKTAFDAIILGNAVESGTLVDDPVFSSGGVTMRQVTGRNAPSVINAVFNFTNFWDGRANNIFNGETPFGPLDASAGAWFVENGALVKRTVAIPNASLASQAVGPALSEVEMSFAGRSFPQLGRKMLSLPPLNRQLVSPNDGVLGTVAKSAVQTGAKGLTTTYRQMIEEAFQEGLWNSEPLMTPEGFTQMEANFSLFWGLAIQLYEATLVSDRTPFDLFQSGNQNALSVAAQRGLSSFDSKCATCHSGAEFTSAAVGSSLPGCVKPDCNPPAFTNNTTHNLLQQNLTKVTGGISDAGFFNVGVRPTDDDPGRGGSAFGLPLSFTRLALLRGAGQLPFPTPKNPFNVPATQPDGINGSFKTPGLRNIELTPPYFHNGGAFTLDEVVEFYSRGGNFPANPELAIAQQPIGKLRTDAAGRAELVEFLKSLTDDRVRNEISPFDHPELMIPSGDPADTLITLQATGGTVPVTNPNVTLNPVTSPAVVTSQLLAGTVDTDASVTVSINGGAPAIALVTGTTWSFTAAPLALGNNTIAITAANLSGGMTTINSSIFVLPVATFIDVPPSITTQTFAVLTVGGNGVVSYQVKIDDGAFSGDIPVSTPISLSGLLDGLHTVTVLGKDGANNQQPLANATSTSWRVKFFPPVLTIDTVATPTRNASQTIGGTIELGVMPSIRTDSSAAVGTVIASGGTWNCQLSGLKPGANTITVTATDIALNRSTASANIVVIVPDGNLKGAGTVDITDAMKALRIAIGVVKPSPEELLHGDVAPLVGGTPVPDDKIDLADVFAIMKKVAGLITF